MPTQWGPWPDCAPYPQPARRPWPWTSWWAQPMRRSGGRCRERRLLCPSWPVHGLGPTPPARAQPGSHFLLLQPGQAASPAGGSSPGSPPLRQHQRGHPCSRASVLAGHLGWTPPPQGQLRKTKRRRQREHSPDPCLLSWEGTEGSWVQ